MKNLILPILATTVLAVPCAKAELVAHFPMDIKDGKITEVISGNSFDVQGNFNPENVAGAVGKALRFDGYTTFVDASLGNIIADGSKQMTFSIWTALETYPIILIDQKTSEKTAIASCLDDSAKTGFGFFIGFDGKWSFKTYIGGWPVEIEISTPLPTYQWNNLAAVIDTSSRTVTIYLNGESVGSSRCSGSLKFDGGSFVLGRNFTDNTSGQFVLNTFNGVIDEVEIWNEALDQTTIKTWTAENQADLSIPSSRYAEDIMRPRFHGMPATAWTNESHGMTYADGKYHVFFQKNADGPYMARLHWGHISSENLFDWTEEKIALSPGEDYDIKGCWSGCVFSDDEITGGKTNIIYTAVDYTHAVIAQASPDDETLLNWSKATNNPIINGRPDGLSDDFRDPYFFRNGDNAYIIVGSSKNGIGTTTLHKYSPTTATWSNDGSTFFTGSNANQDGTFWEMPNVTPMQNGKWLFTATPLNTASGVHAMYWTGSINNDGTFAATSSAGKNIELTSRNGYGLLSPTIYQHDGKTIVLGIVPDKLSSEYNYQLGWAHCYSLPREWSLNDKDELIQKPYSGLTDMRSDINYQLKDFDLSDSQSLSPVNGREAEILGIFTVGNNPFGFKIFKNSNADATISYNPSTGVLTADFSRLNRWSNDDGIYDGIYRCTLPVTPAVGSDLKINAFIDHSIIDIFVNDQWATSLRVFPTDVDATDIEVYAEGSVHIKQLNAWTLTKDSSSGIRNITVDKLNNNGNVYIYNMSGQLLRQNKTAEDALSGLPNGIYILKSGNKIEKRIIKQ